MQVKEHIGGLSPRIMLYPHSIWMGESKHKKILHFLARPIIWPGAQIFIQKIFNHTWAPSASSKRPQIDTGKVHPIRSRSRTRSITTIHAVRRHQSCLPQDNGPNRKIYTDQMGRFPVTYSKGNKYILVAYHYESDTIHAEPLKKRSGLDVNTALPKTPHPIYQQRVET